MIIRPILAETRMMCDAIVNAKRKRSKIIIDTIDGTIIAIIETFLIKMAENGECSTSFVPTFSNLIIDFSL